MEFVSMMNQRLFRLYVPDLMSKRTSAMVS